MSVVSCVCGVGVGRRHWRVGGELWLGVMLSCNVGEILLWLVGGFIRRGRCQRNFRR